MTDARSAVLGLIRRALADDGPASAIPREYRRVGENAPGSEPVVDLMVDRLVDYKAVVRRATPSTLAAEINGALRTARSVVVPIGLDPAVLAACQGDDVDRLSAGASQQANDSDRRSVVVDSDPAVLSAGELDGVDAVVTEASVAIAISGTIVLDARPGQGRRAITLVPDHHIVVLRTSQIVETVAEALARIEPTRPITMIAGPSATSDIELNRVEGVHGPRTLEVIILKDA